MVLFCSQLLFVIYGAFGHSMEVNYFIHVHGKVSTQKFGKEDY